MRPPFYPRPRTSRRQHRRGIALVIVLEVIVLIVILVVGFLSFSSSNYKSSAAYQATVGTRQLTDMAVNLVEAQIADASTQGNNSIWASQPGAIRLFNSSGNLQTVYRLYSAATMTTATIGDLTGDLPPADWSSRSGLWTDLNTPATIVDSSGTSVTEFPILDPRDPANLNNVITMDGFSITNAPGASSTQPAPMPVRWMYLLQNGQLVAPVDSGDGVTMNVSGATAANPIVGRIAFWTDDDSSRLDINTASDGTFWDTPHWASSEDLPLAQYQPAQGEYQRYPGHPATTTLMKVFSAIAPSVINSPAALFNLLPYYSYGGSQEGTTVSTGPIAAKTNPFFASTGEMLFYGNTAGSDGTRRTSGLTRQQLETGKFFLTAHSRSPETNLFGQPRISIWPEYSNVADTTQTTATDRLIAFTSTVNTNPYYFTRQTKDDGTTDINLVRNQSLLNYLDTMTGQPVPGYGGDFDTKYGQAEKRQILTEIFDYIRSTNLRDPTVTKEYGAPTATTPIWSNTPGECQVIPAKHATWHTQGFGNFYWPVEASMIFIGLGQGQITATPTVVPTPVNQAQIQSGSTPHYAGIDSLGTPPANNRAIQAMFVLSFFNPMQGWSPTNPSFTIQVKGLDQLGISAAGTTTSLQMPAQSNAVECIGSYIATISPPVSITRYGSFDYGMGGLGGPMDWRVMTGGRWLSQANDNTSIQTEFPYYSAIVPIDVSKTSTMTLLGAPLTVYIYGGTTTSGPLIGTYNITFPASQTLPVPNLAATGMRLFGSAYVAPNRGNYNGSTVTPPDRFDWYGNWIGTANSALRIMLDTADDVVFSMVPSGNWGDYRMLAASTVPSTAFVAHPSAGPAQKLAYGFCFPDGRITPGSVRGSLVAGASYFTSGSLLAAPDTTPLVPATVTSATFAGGSVGDWDNGVGSRPDGPFINKPDEGCVYANSVSGLPTLAYFDYYPSGDQQTSQPFFSPCRQLPSPVMFGSLPTGVDPAGVNPKPWQTLLFQPGASGHPGAKSPADNLLLDYFWMPYAQPYAISEPFSTEGTVNLNYQIVPFSYINRSTALRSVLASEQVAAVSKSEAGVYKEYLSGTPKSQFSNSRLAIDLDQTLSQFDTNYANGQFFKSSADICNMYLIPKGYTASGFSSTWYGDSFALVGDNERERPYADIYPRVTTRSNIYTVHVTVQMLKNPSKNPAQWNENSAVIVGSYRGSTTIERYIDPNNTTIPDYTANPTSSSTPSLNTFYKWRVLGNSQFAP